MRMEHWFDVWGTSNLIDIHGKKLAGMIRHDFRPMLYPITLLKSSLCGILGVRSHGS